MQDTGRKAIAVVGVGAVLPDAPDAKTFWSNIKAGRSSISELPKDRWDPALYFDPDPKAPDKAYSKIGGWCQDWNWNPLQWKPPIPPRVSDLMDRGQKWAIMASQEALNDYGYPNRPMDADRTAVVFGVAMGGDQQLFTASRIFFPEYAEELRSAASFAALPEMTRKAVIEELRAGIGRRLPPITEDTMPGELANIVAGRVASLFNFHGPNFTADAACASAMAAITAASKGLIEGEYDTVLTGAVDSNMCASTFVKFCKVGALSATGSRPYAEGADGFVMGEGAAVFLLKRLSDAERDGDHIYAVLRGMGGSSDGKGKGITAPNPVGQQFAVRRAWENAGLSPATVGLIEGHGTSTAVGDKAELQVLSEIFAEFNLPAGCIPLGSVKSNIGHLKGGAGASGLLKAVLSVDEKVLPPSLNFQRPNPGFDFSNAPFRVNTELRPWEKRGDVPRRAAVSAFGFGGTNFHAVLEEHVPGMLTQSSPTISMGGMGVSSPGGAGGHAAASVPVKAPLRGALVVGGKDNADVAAKLQSAVDAGVSVTPQAPLRADLDALVRVSIDYATTDELVAKAKRAIGALQSNQAGMWKALKAQGVFRGEGPAPKVAFLYPGQGSQYVNMLAELRSQEPIVTEVFDRADKVMTPLLGGKGLSEHIYCDPNDPAKVAQVEEDLRQTAITQPAVLAADDALTAMLDAYGVNPDMVMGHSLGEYGALVAAGGLPLEDALEAVSARGREMTRVSVSDNGAMVAVFGPLAEIEKTIEQVDGYAVVANINSNSQAVIGGDTESVKKAVVLCTEKGMRAVPLSVSHAFHTSIVAPASEPMKDVLSRLHVTPPKLPLVANVDGEFYPMAPDAREKMIDILGRQIAAPVQFIKGLRTLHASGARMFVEVGPKRALQGFVEDVLGDDPSVSALYTNHPKLGDIPSLNQALCGLYAAGLGRARDDVMMQSQIGSQMENQPAQSGYPTTGDNTMANQSGANQFGNNPTGAPQQGAGAEDMNGIVQLGRMFADFLERGLDVYSGGKATRPTKSERVVVSGGAIGVPGATQVFADENLDALLNGQQLIRGVPMDQRERMVDKNIVRLVKAGGGSRFDRIEGVDEVIKLAGRSGKFDLSDEFGYPKDRLPALDTVTKLAIASGVEAMRDAGIPLVQRYRTTSKGSKLPDRWMLPEELRDDTGVIFASSFPGYDALIDEVSRYHRDKARRDKLADLERLRARLVQSGGDQWALADLDQRIANVRAELDREGYTFDRRFIFKVLPMGHSQFAEYIGARGPNTHVNAACASTTHAVSVAEDWIKAGRCRRVIILSGDNVTSDTMLEWFGPGFLATGAAATDERVEDAATPFDRRRHGLVLGMGAAAMVLESSDAVRERGMRPICEVLSTVTSNSAFHGTRLDIDHICQLMEQLVARAERDGGVNRQQMAAETLFVSHETYTPARGGSAQAEVRALRHTFGPNADKIVVANTKGLTGHAMGVGIEDVVAIKALETGVVPPVPNYKEPDPELGQLNLSRGGTYPIRYALRLGAGFGSQIALSLMHWTPTPNGQRPAVRDLGCQSRIEDTGRWQAWLSRMSGYEHPEIEINCRTLRIKDQGPPADMELATAQYRAVSAPVAPAVPQPAAPVPAAPVPAAPVVQQAAPAPVQDPVVTKVLQIVAGETGYPPEMLDVELDLEADLGIDTVKQAETFAAVREAYDIPRDDNVQLRAFPTLKHVIEFVYERRPELRVAAPAVVAAAPAAAVSAPAAPVQDAVTAKVLQIVAGETGYPPEMLDVELDLEADLGIDTVKQAETFAAVREAYDIPRDDNVQLRGFPTLQHVIEFVYERRPELRAAAPVVTAAPAAPVAPAAVQSTPAAHDAVTARVLGIVSEETGYPPEMLDVELDLEADLGIDTVKQAETFAAVREAYDIPRDEGVELRAFPTLQHVIEFVYEKRPELRVAAPAVAATPAASVQSVPAALAAPVAHDAVTARVLGIVSEETGYPPEMLDVELDLEADLGIDTVKQAETFAAVREAYEIPRDEGVELRAFPTLQHVIEFVYEKRPELRPTVAAAPALAASTAAIPAPAAAPAAQQHDAVTTKVLEIVAGETGYPPEMLDVELDLEADLGIDTVKQAETFAAVREAYEIPRDEGVELRAFPTLQHVIEFVYEKRPELRAAGGAASGASSAALTADVAAGSQSSIRGDMDAANAIPRRVPVPVLRPKLAQCQPTGVTLGKGSRVIVMADQDGVGKTLASRLQKLGVDVLFVDDAPQADALLDRVAKWRGDKAITGVYWLPALDQEAPIAKMDEAGFVEGTRIRVKLLFALMRDLYEVVDKPGTFLISATRLGGKHGYDEAGAVAPMGGAVSGFTKAYKRERGDVLVKCVDFAPSRKTAALADLLVEETLRDAGVVEIGYQDGMRWTVGLGEMDAKTLEVVNKLDKESVFVVTGAAGSIVSAIIDDLATASHGVFHLLDLTPAPDANNPDLKLFAEDKDALKRVLFERLKAEGQRATPAVIEKHIAGIERQYAALSAIESVRRAGGTAHYHSVNLLDAKGITEVVGRIRKESGRVDALVHAGGLEISHFLPSKSPEEFNLVFDVKSNGWFNLLRAIGDMPLGATVVFSSIAGRFGNGGQTDYSAANDLLCKYSSSFRTTRPGTRGIAIDWTAWASIGMAARGSIPEMMRRGGIDMLPPEAGIPVVRRELESGLAEELVVAQRLGILTEEFAPAGGLDVEALNNDKPGPMSANVVEMGLYSGFVIETTLDPREQPFLSDHRIDGTAVLPGVMGIEAFAEAAKRLLPEWHVAAIEHVQFLAPFKFYRDEPRKARLSATIVSEGKDLVARCILTGSRQLPNQPEPQVTVHFQANVRMAQKAQKQKSQKGPKATPKDTKAASNDIYQVYFHGPAYQVVESVWRDGDHAVGLMQHQLPPNHNPVDAPTLMAPRLIELCFQTAGVYEIGTTGKMGLPQHVQSVTTLRDPSHASGKRLFAVVKPAQGSNETKNGATAFDAYVSDESGNVYVSMKGYRTIEMPGGVDPDKQTPLKRAMS